MPHMFHLLFNENQSVDNLYTASWGMPLYLFFLAAAVPIISWAAIKLAISGDPSFTLLYISKTLDSQWLLIASFIAVLSAASGGDYCSGFIDCLYAAKSYYSTTYLDP